ncbi:MAG: hypothetical protein QM504_13750 [Pseudomonadota bacterium]
MITLNTHTTSEINQKATHILFEQMGIVDTFKFLNQFSLGHGDYTKERNELLKDLSLDEIVMGINKRRKDK